MNIGEAVSAPRVHNQWVPDQVYAEPGLPDEVLTALQARGDKVVAQRPFASANSIMVGPNGFFVGATDPRTHDGLAAGY
jgi:gamma-glutamyltranspeptidase/glutathione hydrolase